MAKIPLTPKSKQTLLKLKEELGETTQLNTLERIINDYQEMKTKFKALYWTNELNKINQSKNALEL